MAVPYTFSTATGSLPLSQLDSNFSTAITIGNTAVVLGDSITTINNLTLANVAITSVSTAFPNGYLANSNVIVGTTTLTLGSTVTSINGLSLSNVTISSGNVTISNVTTTNVTATTANVTTANVGTLTVIGNATIGGNATVTGNVSMNVATITTANVTTTNTSSLVVTGNLTFTGTGNRITGDFSNATSSNRVSFQTSTANSNTILSALPSGTGTTGGIDIFNNSDLTNTSRGRVFINTSEMRISSEILGTGTYLPMTFYTGGSERARIDTSGNVGIGITPSYKLHVYNNAAGIASFSQINDSGTALGINNFVMRNASDGDSRVSQFALQVQNAVGNNQQAFIAAQAVTGAAAYSPSIIFGQTTGASTYTERMRINSSGYVGIGTTSPGSKLSIAGTTAGSVPYITFTSAFATASYFGVSTQANDIVTGDALGDLVIDAGSNLLVTTNGNNLRLKIDTSGNLQVQAGAVMPYAPAPAAISAATTLTNANIQGQIISATGTTYTITMALGTTLETLATWATTNIAYDFFVVNTASGIITMAVNTGVTSLGALTVAVGASAHFRIRRTAANTFVLYRLV